MKDSTLFEESSEAYRLINKAMINISDNQKGFYDSIFTDDYEKLDFDDKNMVVGVLLAEYFGDIKDFIDICIKEKTAPIR